VAGSSRGRSFPSQKRIFSVKMNLTRFFYKRNIFLKKQNPKTLVEAACRESSRTTVVEFTVLSDP